MNELKANFKHDKRNVVTGIANFKHDKKNVVTGIACVACGLEEESNSHVMQCAEFEDLREGRDLKNNSDLINFFRDVMTRREKIEKGN